MIINRSIFISNSCILIKYIIFLRQVSNNHGLTRWTRVVYVIIFTSTIPLGIAVGVGLQTTPSGNREIVSAVLEAFATGR